MRYKHYSIVYDPFYQEALVVDKSEVVDWAETVIARFKDATVAEDCIIAKERVEEERKKKENEKCGKIQETEFGSESS